MDSSKAVILRNEAVPVITRMAETMAYAQESGATSVEALAQVQAMLRREDMNWKSIFGNQGSADGGLSLQDLKDWSEHIHNAMGNAHIKRGLSVRSSYIWQGGIQYANVPGKKQGKGVNVQAFIDLPMNQRNFFGKTARRKRETNLYKDCLSIYIGEESTKLIRNIPLKDWDAEYRDPDFDGDVWAYRRTWTSYATGAPVAQSLWYFTDTFIDKRPASGQLKLPSGKIEPVSMDHVAFDQVANAVDGCAYGMPDALVAVGWSRLVKDLFMNGITMTDALATFAFKASVTTKGSGQAAGLKLSTSNGAGSTAVVGGANDLVPMSSAGRGYEFFSFNPVIAIIATALDISVIALTSDPGTAGASYGSASTLDLPTRLAMEARRDEHVDFDLRVLRWMGASDANVYFKTLNDSTDRLRLHQATDTKWKTGLYSALEIKTEFESNEGNDTTNITIPDGVMLPNNENYPDSLDNDDQGEIEKIAAAAGLASAAGSDPSAAANKKSATNKNKTAGNSNDLRTDTISK